MKSKAFPVAIEMRQAKQSPRHARRLGAASRVLRTLKQSLADGNETIVRVVDRGRGRSVVFTGVEPRLQRALAREGAVVVMDANIEVHLPAYRKVLGVEPRVVRMAAADGAPIERTVLHCPSANRNGWFDGPALSIEASLLSAVRHLVDWVLERPETKVIGLITMQAVHLALMAAFRGKSPELETAWFELGQRPAAMDEAIVELGPVLRKCPGEIRFGYYGGIRGMNDMADVDALITVGDPWPNVGTVESEAAFLGPEVDVESRLQALCQAELEQAHGRLRAVHRTRPGRALHVGTVLPSGTGWSQGVKVRRLTSGRPPNESTISVEELKAAIEKLGGVRATARSLGCDDSYLSKCARGQRVLKAEKVETLRSLLG